MARNITVTNLVLAIRERADQVGSTFVSDAEIIRMISASWGELYMKVVGAYPERYLELKTLTADGTSDYAQDATFLSTVWIAEVVSATGPMRRLRCISAEELPLWLLRTGGRAEVYFVTSGSNAILLLPAPPTGQTYRHAYIPVPVDLASGATEINGEAAWEQFIVCDVAGKIAQKEESEHRGHFAERDRIGKRIDEEATLREILEPRRVEGFGDDGYADEADWRFNR